VYKLKQESIMALSFPNVFIGNRKKYGYPINALGYDKLEAPWIGDVFLFRFNRGIRLSPYVYNGEHSGMIRRKNCIT